MIDKPSKGLDKCFLSWKMIYFCNANPKECINQSNGQQNKV